MLLLPRRAEGQWVSMLVVKLFHGCVRPAMSAVPDSPLRFSRGRIKGRRISGGKLVQKNSTQGITVVLKTLYAFRKGHYIGGSLFPLSFYYIPPEGTKCMFSIQDTFSLFIILFGIFEYTTFPQIMQKKVLS